VSESSEHSDCVKVFDEATETVHLGQSLHVAVMKQLVRIMMMGAVDDARMASLLIGLHEKGETAEELVGAAEAMREFMTPIRSTRPRLIDTCGTGGGGTNTFNISTAVAIVSAATGAGVAKHGNKRSTSRSGSSDVLESLGVNIHAPVPVVERCLNELGVCFCFAPLFHPSVKRVMQVRRSLPHPTIFNLLGPLCNPAGTPCQLLGVGRGNTRGLIAEALRRLGTQHTWVVHGHDGLGEISLGAETDVSEVVGAEIRELTVSPEDFGVDRVPLEALKVESAEQSASFIRSVLANEPGPANDIVRINCSVALYLVGIVDGPTKGMGLAGEALASGRAARVLDRLVGMTQEPLGPST
jgi:anthranilate phosphoribosyltransferase